MYADIRLRHAARFLLPGLLLAANPTHGAAQSPANRGGSILMLLTVDSQRLEMGEEARGALSSYDVLSARDNYLDAWELEGRVGETITVDLLSDDFDAYLYVLGPGLGETLADDDSGGGCNARITFTFLESGTFRVVASSNSARQTGTYTIRVTDAPPMTPSYHCGGVNPEVLASLTTDGRSIGLGGVADGYLVPGPVIAEGRYGQAWALEGQAGESVTVTLESDDFDAYLYMYGPGLDEVLSDDDGAGGLNSQITVTLPQSATYLVVASSLQGGATGPYTLSVAEPLDLTTLPTDGRSIQAGDALMGELTLAAPVVVEGRRGQAWALDGEAGQTVTVELRSDEFDTYLYVVGPGLGMLSDDDSAGDLDSRITLTFPENGSYRVIVSALGSSDTGAFTLRVMPN